MKKLRLTWNQGPQIPLRTADDLRNYFKTLMGARELAVARAAQQSAQIVARMAAAIEKDADRLSPETNAAIADAAQAIGAVEAQLQALLAQCTAPKVTS